MSNLYTNYILNKTFIIAEIGSNHNQSLSLAYETIDAAKEAGADAVKFQSINVDKLYHQPSQATIDLHKKIDLPEEWHYLLKEYCDKKDIIFFSSPTYLEAIDILEEIDVPLYKLASAQVGTFPQLIEKVASLGKTVILSTGIVNYGELQAAINIFSNHDNDQFVILHCNSIYPTPYDRVYLPLMDTYRQMFGCPVGFSDHTTNIYAAIAAVARGAKVIEKHFALSRSLPVPDASFSLQPDELKEMVNGIRATESMIRRHFRNNIEQEEMSFKKTIKTCLVMNKDKQEDELVDANDFSFLRSTDGIDCNMLNQLIQDKFRYKRNLKKGELLTYNELASEYF